MRSREFVQPHLEIDISQTICEGTDDSGANRKRFVQMFQDFLPLAMKIIGIDSLPEFEFDDYITSPDQPSFGMYVNHEKKMYVGLANRHPVDILRTIAHELVHYKQDTNHELNDESGRTGSPHENQAHQVAGVVMRHFNKQYPDYLHSKPVVENFADGRNPQDKGDSARHGIKKGTSLAALDKIVHSKTASPRKKQLAHWQANMRRGRKK